MPGPHRAGLAAAFLALLLVPAAPTEAAHGGDLRVRVTIDDDGWRAFAPLFSDFIKAPTDQFVGE